MPLFVPFNLRYFQVVKYGEGVGGQEKREANKRDERKRKANFLIQGRQVIAILSEK